MKKFNSTKVLLDEEAELKILLYDTSKLAELTTQQKP